MAFATENVYLIDTGQRAFIQSNLHRLVRRFTKRHGSITNHTGKVIT